VKRLAVALIAICLLAFLVVSCGPGDGPQDSPGIEVDIDAPKTHKPKSQYKAPKYGKGRR
jgi:hypothetical protein